MIAGLLVFSSLYIVKLVVLSLNTVKNDRALICLDY